MSKTNKRKIVVEENEYFWTLENNSICETDRHIKIHKKGITKSILYIDPYDWYFEIRPKMIRKAIIYALTNGWSPEMKDCQIYIAMQKNEFYVLPKGIEFSYQLKGEEE